MLSQPQNNMRMIERSYLYYHNDGKAIFHDLQLGRPALINGEFEPVVMSEEWLRKVGQMPGEIVHCEPINDGIYTADGDCISGADECALSLLRVTHQDDTVTIEPVYKLFTLDGKSHALRNSLLVYTDVQKSLENAAEFDEFCVKLGAKPMAYFDFCLLQMYCRMYDINMYQAKYRTSLFTATKWLEILPGGKIDDDLCWRYSP